MCENKSQNINYVKTDKKGSVKVKLRIFFNFYNNVLKLLCKNG